MGLINNLHKGDTIYALVPYNNNGFVDYRIEEAKLIRCEEVKCFCEFYLHIKFKYTDFENHRRVIDKKIHINRWNDRVYKAYKDCTGFVDYRYFEVWFSTNKEYLIQQYKDIFRDLSTNAAKEIERLTSCREVYVDRLLTCNIKDYKYEQNI